MSKDIAPKLSNKEITQIKKIAHGAFTKVLFDYMQKDVQQLEDALEDKSLTALDQLMCKLILEAIKKADPNRVNILLDRLIGKPQQQVDVTSDGEKMKNAVVFLPSNGRENERSD